MHYLSVIFIHLPPGDPSSKFGFAVIKPKPPIPLPEPEILYLHAAFLDGLEHLKYLLQYVGQLATVAS